jgi:hypothetical protein
MTGPGTKTRVQRQMKSAGVGWFRPLDHKASHRNTLHLGGALVFQIRRQGSKLIDPWKKARYTDSVVKAPEVLNLQL